ncbi:pectinesterase inhibitor-like [Nicotiana tomentosiformis]|uniref:pectinesterase inhibitor-like n=1 Tax=Nicotiana tomentosiformis TaxID=4098 RepID=UPI00051AE23E|nr:pectinesterase inhibitor-like [Nicotiana tomentosiformis]
MVFISGSNFNLFFLVFLLNVISLGADPITGVCSFTQDPTFCTKAFQSDPRSRTADFAELEIIAIDLGTKSAKNTSAEIRSLISGAKDFRSKSSYTQCGSFYEGIIDSLSQAKNNSKAGNHVDVNLQGKSIINYAVECDELLNEPPPVQSPVLSQDNLFARRYGEMIAVVSKRLLH